MLESVLGTWLVLGKRGEDFLLNISLSRGLNSWLTDYESDTVSTALYVLIYCVFLQEMIREKTLNLFGPILEDQSMLDSLISCQKEVERNRMILEETRYMGDHLEEKFSHYVPMIMQAAMLYNMVQRMSVLHPYYYMPFYKFVEIFTAVIRSRDRGKGTQGLWNYLFCLVVLPF